jgi:CheY-like chemotaxis protein
VVGRPGAERTEVEETLRGFGIEVFVGTEADVLVTPDLMPPVLFVLDDAGGQQERMASMRRLLAHPSLVGVPLIVLSPDSDIDSYSSSLTKGAAAYLVKPVRPAELVEIVRKLYEWVGSHDRTEKRRRLRRPLIMRVDVDIRAQKVKVAGHLMDVSGGGCRIEVGAAIEVGEAIRIILHGYDASTYVALGADVRWQKKIADNVYAIGCRFTGTTALLAGKLLGFVSTGLT